jgi:hypothetical protein
MAETSTFIKIFVDLYNRVTKPTKQVTDSINQISRQQRVLIKTGERLGLSTRRINKAMYDSNLTLGKSGRFYDTVTKKSIKQNDAFLRLNKSSRRFKMEYLSLLFAGMAIERIFGGILRTQFELWGLTEGFSATLAILMIPVMETLSDILWPILQWFMDMPESMKKVFGWFVVIGFILGLVTFSVASTVLALAGLQMILGTKGIISTLTKFGGIVFKVSLVLAGLGLIAYGITEIVKNWGKSTNAVIKGVGITLIGIGVILVAFATWWALLPLAVGAAVFLIAKYWDKLPGWLQKTFIMIYVGAEALMKTLYNTMINPVVAFVKIMMKIMKGDFRGAWEIAKDAVLRLDDPFRNIKSRYDELVKKSEEYTLSQKEDITSTVNTTTQSASMIDSVMKNSLFKVDSYFEDTSQTALNVSTEIEDNWTSMALNNVSTAVGMAEGINKSLDAIYPEVITIHRIVEEKESGGRSSSTKTSSTSSKKGLLETVTETFKSVSKAASMTVNEMMAQQSLLPKYRFQSGGVVPGSPSQAIPILAHGGERITPKNETMKGEIIFSPVYNINVADKSDFERLIKNNNTRMVEDLRRLIQD